MTLSPGTRLLPSLQVSDGRLNAGGCHWIGDCNFGVVLDDGIATDETPIPRLGEGTPGELADDGRHGEGGPGLFSWV